MEMILELHKTKKYILINVALFAFFLFLYTLLDINANASYQSFIEQFGYSVLLAHLLLNVLISLVSSVVLTWSFITLYLNKRDIKGSNIPYIGVVVGFLTFGCTPCVVAFLSIFGITFVPVIFPAANLLWKFVVLGIVGLSLVLTMKNAGKACKVS